MLQEKGFDYLILGQHLVYDAKGKPVYYYNGLDDIDGIRQYKDDLIKGMETGLFLYVCHPDIFMTDVTNVTPEIEEVCKDICEASIKYDIPLELNLGGFGYANLHSQLKGTNPYPNHYFWEIASKYHVKCVIGIDAHRPQDLIDNKLDFAYEFIRVHNLNLVEDLKMINMNCKD